jgi:hypothetical protein
MATSSQRSAQDRADAGDTKRTSSQKSASTNRRSSSNKSTSRATRNTSSRSRARSGNASSGGRGSSGGSRASAQSRSSGRSRSGSGGSSSGSGASSSSPSTSSGTASRGSSAKGKAARAGSGVKSVVLPVATAVGGAAIGVIGGAVLNRKGRSKRKVLGVSIPSVGVGPELEKVARQIGEAAGQFGRLAAEVHAAREQAAKIGKALS